MHLQGASGWCYNIDMEARKDPLVNGQYYHILNRSIAKFTIFNSADDYSRFVELITLYRYKDFNYRYSAFKEMTIENQQAIINSLSKECHVEIISYCLMPTHFHLLLKQNTDNGITKFMSKILNSYTRYFNTKHHRKGPLWEGHFKNVLVKSDEQLLHLTRYIHLNPSSADIVDNPFDWDYSSLAEYTDSSLSGICYFTTLVDLSPKQYKKFVLDQKDYQRKISLIKNFLIDNYSG